jgi:hypothetical protein
MHLMARDRRAASFKQWTSILSRSCQHPVFVLSQSCLVPVFKNMVFPLEFERMKQDKSFGAMIAVARPLKKASR